MKRSVILCLFLMAGLFSVVLAQAPATAPKPSPELQRTAVYWGHWTYEGETKPGPLGPGGKVTGEWDAQMILNAFFLQGRWTEKAATGETRGLEIWWYDPQDKNFHYSVYRDNGVTFSGVLTNSGNIWKWDDKAVVAGKEYPLRGTQVFASDFKSITEKLEVSIDGKTWTIFSGGTWKFTKVQPAPKK